MKRASKELLDALRALEHKWDRYEVVHDLRDLLEEWQPGDMTLKHVTEYRIETLRVNRPLTKGEEAAVLTALIDHYNKFTFESLPVSIETFEALCDRRQELFPMNVRDE